ncbi:MAG: hypothetical protein V1765_01175 [bacterium]
MPYYHWRKIIFYIVLGIIIGYFGRGLLGDSFAKGWQAARDKIEGENYHTIVNDQNQTQYEFIGQIKAIDGKKIIAIDASPSVLTERDLAERTIKVDNDAVISLEQPIAREYWYKLVDAELAQKLADLQKELDSGELDRETVATKQGEVDALIEELDIKHQQTISDLREKISQAGDNKQEASVLRGKLQELTGRYVYETIGLEQLAVGNTIRVISDDDIRTDKSFTATQIIIQR